MHMKFWLENPTVIVWAYLKYLGVNEGIIQEILNNVARFVCFWIGCSGGFV
jgi:hypothetical protein